MSQYHKEHSNFIKNQINFLNKLEKSGKSSTFDYNSPGFRNAFYNDNENGLIGTGRPNLPSDYTSQSQRINNSMSHIKSCNQYLRQASKSLNSTSKSSCKTPRISSSSKKSNVTKTNGIQRTSRTTYKRR